MRTGNHIQSVINTGYRPKQRGFGLNLLQKQGFDIKYARGKNLPNNLPKKLEDATQAIYHNICDEYGIAIEPSEAAFEVGSEEYIVIQDLYEVSLDGNLTAYIDLAVIRGMFNQGPGYVSIFDKEGELVFDAPVYQDAFRAI